MEKKILLIADDDEMNRKIIGKFLKNDYEILHAEDGKKTMEILDSGHVDLLLLDIIMPEMDGLEVLRKMKEDEKYSDVGILVATSTKEKTERTALSLGADDIVSKPYDPVVIKKRVENILASRELHRQKEQLVSHDMDTYLKEQKREMAKKLAKPVHRILDCTEIIWSNRNNLKLVGEMAEEIKLDLNELLEFIDSEE